MVQGLPSRISLVTLLLLSVAAMKAAPVSTKHAQVELIAKQTEVAPGTAALLGVHFVLEQGWHIYWKNPGDSGQPPVFEWQLPKGFSAGEIEWPVPERLRASPELADYGYKDDVLLLVPLRVASGTKSGTSPLITLRAKWLICREVCLPDRAELKLDLSVSSAAKDDADREKLFISTEHRLPRPLPRGWTVSAVEDKDNFILKVSAGRSLKKAQFFPADPGQIDNAARQVVRSSPQGVTLQLKKSDLLLKRITVLRGVLSVGGRVAYEVQARVRAAQR